MTSLLRLGLQALFMTGLVVLGSGCGGGAGSGNAPPVLPTAAPTPLVAAPASVVVVASPAALPLGQAGTVALTLVAKGANGNPIATPATYAFPLTVGFANASDIRLSAPAFTAPGQTIIAFYDGAGPQQVVSFTVSGGTLAPSGITAANVPVVTARPDVTGASFTYAGTLTQAIQTTILNTAPPGPAPTGTPQTSSSVTLSYTAAQTVTVLATASPAIDQHTVETDTLAGNGKVTQTTSDAILQYPASFSGNLTLSSLTWTDALQPGIETATTDTTTYATGNGTVDVLPETTGASWSNTAAHTEVEASTDGRTTSVVASANGSYSMTLTGPPANSVLLESISENADGSGLLSLPCGTFNCNLGGVYRGVMESWVFAAPTATSQTITVPSLAYATPPPSPVTVSLWYPYPPVLWSDAGSVTGPAAIPAACNVPAAAGPSATQTVRNTAILDTIVGSTETTTTATYDILGIGVVCTTSTDVLTTYYDTAGINAYSPTFYGVPISKTTTTETLGITASSLAVLASARRPAALAAIVVRPGSPSFARLVQQAREAARQPFLRGAP